MAHFLEEQRFRQFWIYLLLAIPGTITWWGFLEQIILGRPWGDQPAPNWVVILTWLVFGIGLPVFFWSLNMRTRVDAAAVVVAWRPIRSGVTLDYGEIARHEAITYRPIREFGGWGVRWGGKQRRAYNVSGDRGVEVFLTDGRCVVIGSQRPDELANAIAVGAAEAIHRRRI